MDKLGNIEHKYTLVDKFNSSIRIKAFIIISIFFILVNTAILDAVVMINSILVPMLILNLLVVYFSLTIARYGYSVYEIEADSLFAIKSNFLNIFFFIKKDLISEIVTHDYIMKDFAISINDYHKSFMLRSVQGIGFEGNKNIFLRDIIGTISEVIFLYYFIVTNIVFTISCISLNLLGVLGLLFLQKK